MARKKPTFMSLVFAILDERGGATSIDTLQKLVQSRFQRVLKESTACSYRTMWRVINNYLEKTENAPEGGNQDCRTYETQPTRDVHSHQMFRVSNLVRGIEIAKRVPITELELWLGQFHSVEQIVTFLRELKKVAKDVQELETLSGVVKLMDAHADKELSQ